MKRIGSVSVVVWILAALLPPLPAGAAPGEPGVEVVYLQKDCSGHTLGVDCFRSLATLQDKVWPPGVGRSANEPLIVDVGPGEFDGFLSCPLDSGYVTFRGAGRDRTILANRDSSRPPGAIPVVYAVIWSLSCNELAFKDMTLLAADLDGQANLNGYTIFWGSGPNGGSSHWTNVDIIGDRAAWYDVGCPGQNGDEPAGEHLFWNTRLIAGVFGYAAECGEARLYGSEILVDPGSFRNQNLAEPVIGVLSNFRSDVHLFGSVVRVTTANATPAQGVTAYGATVGLPLFPGTPLGDGSFHMHDGIINVEATGPATAVGIDGDTAGGAGAALARSAQAAFNLEATAGIARIRGDADIQSPYLWPSGTGVPIPSLVSLNGQDMYVETDCDAVGCAGGSDPHPMVYKADCPGEPWFDQVLGACRN